jgi:hypothetical protein
MKVTLKRFETMLQGELPREPSTLYKWSSKKVVNWLDRTDPAGHRGRELWVDVQGYNSWAEVRGHKVVQLKERGARN